MTDRDEDMTLVAQDTWVHAVTVQTPEWEAEEKARAEFEDERAFQQWQAARLADDPQTPAGALTREAYADELVARAEARHEP